jgi:hypothetical protein
VISGSHGVEYEDGFWNVAPWSLAEIYWRLGGVYCFYRQVIALMMEAVRTSKTSVNFYQTILRDIPEDGQFLFHTRL